MDVVTPPCKKWFGKLTQNMKPLLGQTRYMDRMIFQMLFANSRHFDWATFTCGYACNRSESVLSL